MSQEVGKVHVKSLEIYLSGLRAKREGLPSRNGKVNMSAVATASGFNREVLYQNPLCKKLLQDAVTSLGLRGVENRDQPEDTEKVKLERRVTQLEQQNAALTAEVHELRRRLTQYQHIEEILESGKRVIL